ncbi:unnamed protein product, partial [Scytosiphon promiscuus]
VNRTSPLSTIQEVSRRNTASMTMSATFLTSHTPPEPGKEVEEPGKGGSPLSKGDFAADPEYGVGVTTADRCSLGGGFRPSSAAVASPSPSSTSGYSVDSTPRGLVFTDDAAPSPSCFSDHSAASPLKGLLFTADVETPRSNSSSSSDSGSSDSDRGGGGGGGSRRRRGGVEKALRTSLSKKSGDLFRTLVDADDSEDEEQHHHRQCRNRDRDLHRLFQGEGKERNASEDTITAVLNSFRAEVKRELMAEMSCAIDALMDKAANGAYTKLTLLIEGLFAENEHLRGELSKLVGRTATATVETSPNHVKVVAAVADAAGRNAVTPTTVAAAVTAASDIPHTPAIPDIADSSTSPATPVGHAVFAAAATAIDGADTTLITSITPGIDDVTDSPATGTAPDTPFIAATASTAATAAAAAAVTTTAVTTTDTYPVISEAADIAETPSSPITLATPVAPDAVAVALDAATEGLKEGVGEVQPPLVVDLAASTVVSEKSPLSSSSSSWLASSSTNVAAPGSITSRDGKVVGSMDTSVNARSSSSSGGGGGGGDTKIDSSLSPTSSSSDSPHYIRVRVELDACPRARLAQYSAKYREQRGLSEEPPLFASSNQTTLGIAHEEPAEKEVETSVDKADMFHALGRGDGDGGGGKEEDAAAAAAAAAAELIMPHADAHGSAVSDNDAFFAGMIFQDGHVSEEEEEEEEEEDDDDDESDIDVGKDDEDKSAAGELLAIIQSGGRGRGSGDGGATQQQQQQQEEEEECEGGKEKEDGAEAEAEEVGDLLIPEPLVLSTGVVSFALPSSLSNPRTPAQAPPSDADAAPATKEEEGEDEEEQGMEGPFVPESLVLSTGVVSFGTLSPPPAPSTSTQPPPSTAIPAPTASTSR